MRRGDSDCATAASSTRSDRYGAWHLFPIFVVYKKRCLTPYLSDAVPVKEVVVADATAAKLETAKREIKRLQNELLHLNSTSEVARLTAENKALKDGFKSAGRAVRRFLLHYDPRRSSNSASADVRQRVLQVGNIINEATGGDVFKDIPWRYRKD